MTVESMKLIERELLFKNDFTVLLEDRVKKTQDAV
jgi:hypothetical protein